MADIEVHIDLDGRTRHIGLARSNRVRGAETVIFGYDGDWLEESSSGMTATGWKTLADSRWSLPLPWHAAPSRRRPASRTSDPLAIQHPIPGAAG